MYVEGAVEEGNEADGPFSAVHQGGEEISTQITAYTWHADPSVSRKTIGKPLIGESYQLAA